MASPSNTQPSSLRRLAPALALGLAALSACHARTRRTPDDTIVVVIPNLIRDLDPRFSITSYDTKLSRLVAPGLTTTSTPTMEPALALAESIERVGESDQTWDVVLRPGLRFSDGSPVTAADVAWTYESTLDPKVNSVDRAQFEERYASVEAIDDRRVRFHLKVPLGTFRSDLEFGIISHAAAGADGRYAGGIPVGAGPYRAVSMTPERVVLERNPYYAGPPPPVPRVEVLAVRDQNAALLMMVGGSADLAQNTVRPDLVDDVGNWRRLHITTGPSGILSYLMMQNEHPILSDVRVRQAIAYAIDRKAIIAAKFRGHAVLATGLLPPGHWAYEKDVTHYDFDPARARQLLDDAGYPDPDGPGGQPRFHLTYKTSADSFRVAVARIIASQLAEVGIDVEVRAFEWGTFFTDIKKGNYDLASMQTAPIADPDWGYPYFHSSRIPTPDNLNGHNRWRYRNPEVDTLLERGRRTMGRADRLAIYSQVQKILARDVPVVPLWHEDNVAVTNADLRGYQLTPNAYFDGLATAKK